jgi:DNA-binding MarR family transcriptional regulator
MADIKYAPIRGDALHQPTLPPSTRSEDPKQGLDLLLAAVRDLNDDIDPRLKAEGLGRADGRALSAIGRAPGLSVADLLFQLRVTKQSLSGVLAELMAGGYVEQQASPADRRKRLLGLTAKGEKLDEALWQDSRARLAEAFHEVGPEAAAGFRKVLKRFAGKPGTDRA